MSQSPRGKQILWILAGLGLAATVLIWDVRPSVAGWSSPNASPPASTVAPPLTTGWLHQTKAGGLEFSDDLTIQQSVTTGSITARGRTEIVPDGAKLCLNNDCIEEWGALEDDYVHLYDPGGLEGPDSGEPNLVGEVKVYPEDSAFAVNGQAASPSSGITAGLLGNSSDDPAATQETIGVKGLASTRQYCSISGKDCSAIPCPDGEGVCVNNSQSYGVWGSSGGLADAWAGRFDGRVGVDGELCINDDCRSSWDAPSLSGFVRVQSSRGPTLETQPGNVQVLGTLKSGHIVLGQPPPGLSLLLSCGDGFCTNNNGEWSGNCPVDCSGV